jgi:hypothetical protein
MEFPIRKDLGDQRGKLRRIIDQIVDYSLNVFVGDHRLGD